MTAANTSKSIKCLFLLVITFLAGCNIGISEEGQDRCLRYARDQQNDFVAEKIYERCLKTIMAILRREKEEERKRKAEQDRRHALAQLRSEVRLQQDYKLRSYTNWQYWPSRLVLINSSDSPASCIASTESGTSTEVFFSIEDPGNLLTECVVSDSLYFTKNGFRIASISSLVHEGVQHFGLHEYDARCGVVRRVKERSLASLVGREAYGVFKPIETIKDPFSGKEYSPAFAASVSVWSSGWRESQGSREELQTLVDRFCDLQRKFWNDSDASFLRSMSG